MQKTEEIKTVMVSVKGTDSHETPNKTRRRRRGRAQKQTVGTAVVKTEVVNIVQKPHQSPVGKQTVTKSVLKIIPKPNGTIKIEPVKKVQKNNPIIVVTPTVKPDVPKIPVKIAIMPKTKKVTKIKFVGKNQAIQKPIFLAPTKTQVTHPVMIKTKLDHPEAKKKELHKKTRKNFKERKINIDL